jgi:hypothetical protein
MLLVAALDQSFDNNFSTASVWTNARRVSSSVVDE